MRLVTRRPPTPSRPGSGGGRPARRPRPAVTSDATERTAPTPVDVPLRSARRAARPPQRRLDVHPRPGHEPRERRRASVPHGVEADAPVVDGDRGQADAADGDRVSTAVEPAVPGASTASRIPGPGAAESRVTSLRSCNTVPDAPATAGRHRRGRPQMIARSGAMMPCSYHRHSSGRLFSRLFGGVAGPRRRPHGGGAGRPHGESIKGDRQRTKKARGNTGSRGYSP